MRKLLQCDARSPTVHPVSNKTQARINDSNAREVRRLAVECEKSGISVSFTAVVNMALAAGVQDVRKRLLGK